MFPPLLSFLLLALALLLPSPPVAASGMQPQTSVVVLEEAAGEAVISVSNSEHYPALLLTTLQTLPQDKEALVQVAPPAIRVDAGKKQSVRFLLTSAVPLKTERLRRVIFEGVAPSQKGENQLRMTIAQNIPLIIRPAGLPRHKTPWTLLKWTLREGSLRVHNPSPYVVRLAQQVNTLPGNGRWLLPQPYVLPGETLQLSGKKHVGSATAQQVRLYPATSWGFTVDSWDAPLSR